VSYFTSLTAELGVQEPAVVADAIVATMVGAVMLSRLTVVPATAKSILDNTKMAINTMLQPAAEGHDGITKHTQETS